MVIWIRWTSNNSNTGCWRIEIKHDYGWIGTSVVKDHEPITSYLAGGLKHVLFSDFFPMQYLGCLVDELIFSVGL